MNKIKIGFILGAFLFFAQTYAQLGDNKFPSYFGIQVKTLFPSSFIANPNTIVEKEGLSATLHQKIGYSFGATVRAGLTEFISLETGINYTQRFFDISGSIADSNVFINNQMGFIQYDIPINALIYIKMTKKWYANASLGFAAGFKPTSIATTNNLNGSQFFYNTGVVQKKFSLDLNGNFGFEYRSKKAGVYYVGTSVRLPLKPLFVYVATYKNQGYKVTQYGDVAGGYLSVDFKYFFHTTRARDLPQRPIE
ncbi:MAG: hypothetical protein EBR74_10395 [Flavobacteriia bacterium]|nr:hypothetical protein [Flavobacteriia bacterium]